MHVIYIGYGGIMIKTPVIYSSVTTARTEYLDLLLDTVPSRSMKLKLHTFNESQA